MKFENDQLKKNLWSNVEPCRILDVDRIYFEQVHEDTQIKSEAFAFYSRDFSFAPFGVEFRQGTGSDNLYAC